MESHESEFSTIREEGSLKTLAQLHQRLRHLLPYDAVARESWFDDAARLLAEAGNASERVDWLTMLAWAYKQQPWGQGIPIQMIMGRLIRRRDTCRLVLR